MSIHQFPPGFHVTFGGHGTQLLCGVLAHQGGFMSLSDAGQPTSHSWDGLSLVTGPVPIEHLVTALDMDAGKRWQHILMVDDFDGLPSRIVNEVLLPRAEAFMRADPVGCLRELATAARTLLELIQAAMAAEVVDSQDDSWAACAVRTG